MTDRISNTYNQTVGSAKEKIGKAVGSEHLASHGAAQKAEGQVNQQRATAETHAQGLGNQAQGAAQKAVGGATNDPELEARGHVNAAMGDAQRNV